MDFNIILIMSPVVLFIILVFWWCIDFAILRHPKAFKDRIEELHSGTYLLKQRTPSLKRILKLKKHKIHDFHANYVPEKQIYTSATNGRFTVGGFTTVGGYETLAITSSHRTDKAEINFREMVTYSDWPRWIRISDIVLTPELYEQAKNSHIKDYVHSDGENMWIELIDTSSVDRSAAKAIALARSEADFASAANKMQRQALRGYPSYEKAKDIFDWMCGIDKTIDTSGNEVITQTTVKHKKVLKPVNKSISTLITLAIYVYFAVVSTSHVLRSFPFIMEMFEYAYLDLWFIGNLLCAISMIGFTIATINKIFGKNRGLIQLKTVGFIIFAIGWLLPFFQSFSIYSLFNIIFDIAIVWVCIFKLEKWIRQ